MLKDRSVLFSIFGNGIVCFDCGMDFFALCMVMDCSRGHLVRFLLDMA